MKRKIVISIFCLAFASLACLDTSAALIATAQPTLLAERIINSTPTLSAAIAEDPTSTNEPQLCAVVIADEAVHLRLDADPRSRILSHLRKGDQLHVIDRAAAEWWLVTRGGYLGFVRSNYLEVATCQTQ